MDGLAALSGLNHDGVAVLVRAVLGRQGVFARNRLLLLHELVEGQARVFLLGVLVFLDVVGLTASHHAARELRVQHSNIGLRRR